MLRLGMEETELSVSVGRSLFPLEVLMEGMGEMEAAYTWWVMKVNPLCFLSDIKRIFRRRKGLMGRARICTGRGERTS